MRKDVCTKRMFEGSMIMSICYTILYYTTYKCYIEDHEMVLIHITSLP